MPRKTKDAPGRVTPKGGAKAAGRPTSSSASSGRYTPPIPKEYRESSRFWPFVILAFFAAGILMILLNYLSVLPGSVSGWYLAGGLALIFAGFWAATRYR